jgi:hypothetical protein
MKKRTRRWMFALLVFGAGLAGSGYYLSTKLGSAADHVMQSPTTPAQRNDVRRQQVKLLASETARYIAAHGTLPIIIPPRQVPICSSTGAVCRSAGYVDLMFLASSGYIEALPSDPVGGHQQQATGYTIGRDTSNGAITVVAPRAEAGAVISRVVQ